MTMKSCFYPLIGDRIFGWMGDVIDVVSIMSTLFGVCTSLGLGARQLNFGLSIITPEIAPDDITIQVRMNQFLSIIMPIRSVCKIYKIKIDKIYLKSLRSFAFGVSLE